MPAIRIRSSSRRGRCSTATARGASSTSGWRAPASTTPGGPTRSRRSSASATSTTSGSRAPGRRRSRTGATGTTAIRHDLDGHGVAAEAVDGAIGALEPEAERAAALVARLGPRAEDGARSWPARGSARTRSKRRSDRRCGVSGLSCRVQALSFLFACITHIPLIATALLKPTFQPLDPLARTQGTRPADDLT